MVASAHATTTVVNDLGSELTKVLVHEYWDDVRFGSRGSFTISSIHVVYRGNKCKFPHARFRRDVSGCILDLSVKVCVHFGDEARAKNDKTCFISIAYETSFKYM